MTSKEQDDLAADDGHDDLTEDDGHNDNGENAEDMAATQADEIPQDPDPNSSDEHDELSFSSEAEVDENLPQADSVDVPEPESESRPGFQWTDPSSPDVKTVTGQVISEQPEIPPIRDSEVTFRGNNYDLTAVVGVTIGGIVLASCGTCNLGLYFLPFVPLILGIIGLVNADESVDPKRTKLLSWISIAAGAAILVLGALGIIFFLIVAMMGEGF